MQGAGGSLLLARALHAVGIRADGTSSQLNFAGAPLTSLVVRLLSLGLLVSGVRAVI